MKNLQEKVKQRVKKRLNRRFPVEYKRKCITKKKKQLKIKKNIREITTVGVKD